ncbi:NAD-dependent epimerase/dehydratase family protein (plasmid) [Nocardia sp. NBC_01377]|uniref:NAD-dependent epimerase/dehydratase family protein n=1 Tax=Nocardia sp. NBC_01377 TaxID=2903595 RepID=UPI002F916A59
MSVLDTSGMDTTFPAATGKVLVTGGTGYIAGHIIADLLEHGYSVRATVRDITDSNSHAHLIDIAERHGGALEFVRADLTSDTGWDNAARGCTAVLHTASPMLSTDPSQMVSTAVDGTLRVLRAAADSPSTRRVVLTSSTHAVDGSDTDGVLTEAHWSPTRDTGPYEASKTLSERAAWDFVAALPPEQLELVTILPGMVIGPLHHRRMCISLVPVQRLLAGTLPGLINVGWPMVDVRDLATVHRLAMASPRAAGNRYLCAGEQIWMPQVAQILTDEFGPHGFDIPSRRLPDWAVRLIAIGDREARLTVPVLGKMIRISTAKLTAHFGVPLRPAAESIIDTAHSLLEHQFVPLPPHNRSPGVLPAFAGMRP